ncbi:MAG: hypothetical protein GY915_06000 [bacterium]|nr:hypothetical protein [bacterium]
MMRLLLSQEFSDKYWSFEFANRKAYSGGVYHTKFEKRKKFVTLFGSPVIKMGKGQLFVTWEREFDGKKDPRLFTFNYKSLVKKIIEEEKKDKKDKKNL